MEGLLIVGGLALVLYGVLWFLTWRSRRRLARALSTAEQRLNVAQAKLRAAEGYAEQVRQRMLGWDQPAQDMRPGHPDLPPRVGIVPAPDGAMRQLEPVRPVWWTDEPMTEEQRIEKAWEAVESLHRDLDRLPEPTRITEVVRPESEAPEPSPLYAETLATLPTIQSEMGQLTAAVRDEPAWPDLTGAYEVEETLAADEDVPQDEARVTERRRDDDSPTGPRPGPPDGHVSDGPRVDETAPLAAVAVYRHDWSRAQHPVGPLHGARPHPSLARDGSQWLASRTQQVWARIWAVPQVRVQRPSWWRRLWRSLSAVWPERVAEAGQVWASGELGDGHLIVRHRAGGGTWQVA